MADKNKVIEVIYKAIDEVNNLLPADRRLDKRMDVVFSTTNCYSVIFYFLKRTYMTCVNM